MDAAIPMVNGRTMKSYIGQRVSILGVVLHSDMQMCKMRLSDNEEINVHIPMGTAIETPYIEIVGKVVGPGTVEAMRVQAAGSNIDMESHNKLVELAHGTFKQLFV